jgi:crotonobetainyl-CoA:carnitine CoA-transferase CaiB-like acyl-CoA transferase
MTAKGAGPLAGVRIVEFAHVVAGPLAGGLMADLGADVVHVEPPGTGDAARKIGPHKDDVYLWWKVSGRNKQSITLDLRRPEAREIAYDLVREADVVIVGMRASTLEAWGLTWEVLREVNPKLIMLQVSGMGARSSAANAPGFGKVGEARSGVVHLTGFPDGPPVHTGFSHGDSVTGLMGAFSVCAALYRRATDEAFKGEWIDLALFEGLYRLIEWQVIVHDQLGIIPERAGNRLPVAPAAIINTYKTSEGDWITVTSATPRSVHNIVRLLGLPVEDFATVEAQIAARDMLDSRMAEWALSRTTEESIRELLEAEVVASRIFNVADILEDPIYNELGDVITIDDEDLGPVRMQGVIPRLENYPGQIWRTGPSLGEDNAEVLTAWLGFDAGRIAELMQSGVMGQPDDAGKA